METRKDKQWINIKSMIEKRSPQKILARFFMDNLKAASVQIIPYDESEPVRFASNNNADKVYEEMLIIWMFFLNLDFKDNIFESFNF